MITVIHLDFGWKYLFRIDALLVVSSENIPTGKVNTLTYAFFFWQFVVEV